MKVNELQKRLREKERELWADMSRTEAEARNSGMAETQDGDAAAERKEGLFQKVTSDWNMFTQVRDALQRIEKGTYGKCADCGRQIEDHRLNHQNRHDEDLLPRPA